MNQTFKQKAIVAAITAAVAIGGASVTTQAFANQFESTSVAAVVGAGVSVGKSADVATAVTPVTGQVVTFTEAPAKSFSAAGTVAFGSIGTASSLVLGLTNSARWAAADNKPSLTLTASNGVGIIATASKTATVASNGDVASLTVNGDTFTFTFTTAASSIVVTRNGTSFMTVTNRDTTAAAGANTALLIKDVLDAAFGAGTVLVNGAAYKIISSSATIAGATTWGTNVSNAGAQATNFGQAAGAIAADTTAGFAPTVGGTNNTLLTVPFLKNTQNTAGTLELSAFKLNTNQSTVGQPVAITVDATTTAAGVTAGASINVANVATSGITVTNGSGTLPSVAPGQAVTIRDLIVTEAVAGSISNGANTNKPVTITLPSGWKFTSSDVTPTFSNVDSVSIANDVNEQNANVTSTNISGATSNGAGVLKFSGFQVTPPASATSGTTYQATVRVYTGASTFADYTVDIAKVVAVGTNATVVDNANTAVTTIPTLFTGRTYKSGVNVPNSSPAVDVSNAVRLKLQETATATLLKNAYVQLTLTNGEYETGYATNPADTGAVTGDASAIVSGTTNAIRSNISAVSSAATDYLTFNVFDDAGGKGISLANSAVGKLSVTVGGTAGATAQAVDLANLINATNASTSGAQGTVAVGALVSLPDLVVTESQFGAVPATDDFLVELPAGYKIQTAAGVDATDTGTLVNGTDVTFKAYKADGTEVTGIVTSIKTNDVASTGTIRQLAVDINAASTSTTGPLKYVISGLKAKVATDAVAGDITVLVGSAATSVTPASLATTGSATGATKASVKVGSVVSASKPAYPAATVADQTKLTLANLPLTAAGDDQGKQGAVYVALIFQGNVFFQGADGSWTAYTGGSNVPAYFTGTLGTTTLNIVPTALDVTAAKGALFVTGYGIGIAGLSNPFDEFIKSARYNVVYTVK